MYWSLTRRELTTGLYLNCLFLLLVHSLHFFGGSHLYPYLESQSGERRVRAWQPRGPSAPISSTLYHLITSGG